MTLSVVIPSCGLDGLLRQCLSCLEASAAAAGIEQLHVVVVDNASPVPYRPDDLGSSCDLEIVRFDVPTSFARACNIGASRRADASELLFLNNDVLLHRGALGDMNAAKSTHCAHICGARLVYPDGTIQHCGVLFDGGDRGPYHHRHRDRTDLVPRQTRRLQSVTGACLLVDRRLFDRLGGFDEQFPFAYEDVDFCLRAGQLGATIVCAQGVDSIHLQGSSRDERAFALERLGKTLFFARWRGRFSVDGSTEDP